MLFGFIQINFGQVTLPVFYDPTGIIWVVPNRPDALPVNVNRTGNSGLNMAFEDYHVIEYTFLDSFYIETYIQKIPIYQIRIDPEYANLEYEFISIIPGFQSFGDIVVPCGPYSGISTEEVKSIQVFPNPAQDEISIIGVIPE